MKELLVATRNAGKIRELKLLLKEYPIAVTSLLDYPDMPEIIEDAETFEGNAAKKAVVIAQHTGRIVMGEDSGLSVEALGGRPGVYSARYAGEKATDQQNNTKLLQELKDVPMSRRKACYHSYIALADPKGVIGVVSGTCHGIIATEPHGTNGFGYDPLFIVPQYHKTFGQLNPSIKAEISHRSWALKKFKLEFGDYLKRL
ncbi:MAG: XTP/dITP diphosphatase [Candidatus Omnitrophica bacterium]|nr:XTP/dITP diphosphatase [Candidatus Omnitrophota bacterium]